MDMHSYCINEMCLHATKAELCHAMENWQWETTHTGWMSNPIEDIRHAILLYNTPEYVKARLMLEKIKSGESQGRYRVRVRIRSYLETTPDNDPIFPEEYIQQELEMQGLKPDKVIVTDVTEI